MERIRISARRGTRRVRLRSRSGAASFTLRRGRDATHATARFASCSVAGSCAGWTATAIDDPASSDCGAGTVLTADPVTGYPRLAYVDRTNGVLRVLASDGSASFSPIAELPTSAAPGASIAFGAGTWIAHSSGGVRVFGGP